MHKKAIEIKERILGSEVRFSQGLFILLGLEVKNCVVCGEQLVILLLLHVPKLFSFRTMKWHFH